MNIQNAVLDGFSADGNKRNHNFRSGCNYTIVVANDLANVLAGEERANGTGVTPSRLDPRTNNLLALDRAAYATPARGFFGNLGRNTQYGFGINNWDLGVNKNFAIRYLGEGSGCRSAPNGSTFSITPSSASARHGESAQSAGS